jgi:hypothetical protein
MAQVLRKQRESLIYDFTLLVARVSALLVGGAYRDRHDRSIQHGGHGIQRCPDRLGDDL